MQSCKVATAGGAHRVALCVGTLTRGRDHVLSSLNNTVTAVGQGQHQGVLETCTNGSRKISHFKSFGTDSSCAYKTNSAHIYPSLPHTLALHFQFELLGKGGRLERDADAHQGPQPRDVVHWRDDSPTIDWYSKWTIMKHWLIP